MENASKALLMAAGVLMGMMILSLAVYLFTNFGGTSSQIHENIETNQINQFNSQFTSYVGKENVTIHDIVSMANLATQNNQNYEFARRSRGEVTGNDLYIQVLLDGTPIEYGAGWTSDKIKENYNDLISDDISLITTANDTLKTYDVQVEISDVTRRVFRVICTEK